MDGTTLTIIRTLRNIRQTDIAAALGVTRPAISMMEHGRRRIRAEQRAKLREMGINLDDPAINAAIAHLHEAINGRAQS